MSNQTPQTEPAQADASDVIATLSQQISSLSVDLAIARAQITALQRQVDDLATVKAK
ncbi:hypothetical protein [Bifidobacterium scardovii]|jgi:hypothetical protein|uniref:hypothetical protein n=1 Tax=Bifidobacterium scardovii TaxID=158787 RepID=UPI000B2F3099|nr:hypothetical protein [Bifidobacterium scardovii]MBS6948308.1 hypothetical protein [Bifidobacterium scardovii]MDU3737559.1 hypothetical protein [Bifidobacterium scardovii]MDU5610287.1 hypothetical protein [Bifidobacterium scardovii]DAO75380.1 MAG TPA: hypothetical protein [Caudoviricetes sp.]